MLEEIWKAIPTYSDYKVSSLGQVRNIKKNRFIKPYNTGSVELFNSEGSSTWTVYVLMACAFLGLDITDPFRNRVLFKDGDKSNLTLDNIYIEDTSDLPGEIWKQLNEIVDPDVKAKYMISNKGRLKTTKHIVQTTFKGKVVERHCPECILNIYDNNSGYLGYVLDTNDGRRLSETIHRLVALAFCPNDDPKHKTFINHIDSNKHNNCAENLEWCTPKYNTAHAVESSTMEMPKGRFDNKPLVHIESGTVYESLSAASRAMGRYYGYISDRMKLGKPCTDKDGNVWTFNMINAEDIPKKEPL